jgi:lipopolysaccharide export system permease protein
VKNFFTSKLDRYLVRCWLPYFLLSLVACLGLIVLEDLYHELKRFWDLQAPWRQVAWYYAALVPTFLPQLLPLAFGASVVYALGLLQRSGQIIAMRACGLSLGRITRTLWVASGLLGLVLLGLNAQLVPTCTEAARGRYALALGRQQQTGFSSPSVRYNVCCDNTHERRLWWVERFWPLTGLLEGISLHQRDPHTGQEHWRLKAESGHFDAAQQAWIFYQGSITTWSHTAEPQNTQAVQEDFEAWVAPHWPERPSALNALDQPIADLSWKELQALLQSPFLNEAELRYPYRLAYAKQLSSPLILPVMLGLAVPLVCTGTRSNPIVGLSYLVLGLVLYFGLGLVAGQLGQLWALHPAWVVAAPNALFAAIGYGLHRRLG